MRRTRNMSQETKIKISNAMKRHHQSRTDAQKAITKKRQSLSMQRYWDTIPVGQHIGTPIKGCIKPKNGTKNLP